MTFKPMEFWRTTPSLLRCGCDRDAHRLNRAQPLYQDVQKIVRRKGKAEARCRTCFVPAVIVQTAAVLAPFYLNVKVALGANTIRKNERKNQNRLRAVDESR